MKEKIYWVRLTKEEEKKAIHKISNSVSLIIRRKARVILGCNYVRRNEKPISTISHELDLPAKVVEAILKLYDDKGFDGCLYEGDNGC